MKYSKIVVEKVITNSRGEKVRYSASPMGALSTAKEGFKLIKAFLPSIGAGVDSFIGKDQELLSLGDNSYTLATMLSMLSENINDEHFEDLQDKLLGSLMLGDTKIIDIDDHFDKNAGDYIEVMIWLFKANFANFIMESVTLRSKIASLMNILSPEMKEKLEIGLNALKTETD